MIRVHFDTETHANHLGFARSQDAIEQFLEHVAQVLQGRRGHRGVVVFVLHEIAQGRVVFIAHGGFQGNRVLHHVQQLTHFFLGHAHLFGEPCRIGFTTEFLMVGAHQAVDLVHGFHHVHRDANHAALVRDGARDGLTNPPSGVCRELIASTVFEFVHGAHQTDVAFLEKVQELHAAIGVLLGNGNHEAQVGLDHLGLGLFGGIFRNGHSTINRFELAQGNHRTALQLHQLFLLFLNGRLLTQQLRAVFLSFRFAGRPSKVHGMQRERGNEMLLGHARQFHGHLANLAFARTHVVHLAAQGLAQGGDDARGETEFGYDGGDQGLGLVVFHGTVAFAFVCLAQFGEGLFQMFEFLQRLQFAFFQARGAGRVDGVFIGVWVYCNGVRNKVFFVAETIHHFIDGHLAGFDGGAQIQHLMDGRGRMRNGLHHFGHAFFDLTAQLGFLVLIQQRHAAHFAHVHAHRVAGLTQGIVHGTHHVFHAVANVFVGTGYIIEHPFHIRFGFQDVQAHRFQALADGFFQIGTVGCVRQNCGQFRAQNVPTFSTVVQQFRDAGLKIGLFVGSRAFHVGIDLLRLIYILIQRVLGQGLRQRLDDGSGLGRALFGNRGGGRGVGRFGGFTGHKR